MTMIQRLALSHNVQIPSSVKNLIFPFDLDRFFKAYNDAVFLLRDAEDFKEALSAYLTKARAQGVVYSEVMVDMQNYISRLKFSEVIRGLRDGIELHRGSIDCKIIICLNGDNDESEALDMIEQSKNHQDIIVAIGMATSQESLPVKKFERAFLLAKDYGFKTCSHFWDADCCS